MDEREELAALRRMAELETKEGGGKPPRSAAYQAGRGEGGAMQGLLSVAQGPTFGFADELLGGVGALMKRRMEGGQTGVGAKFRQAVGIDKAAAPGFDGLRTDYKNIRDFARGAADEQQDQNPIPTALTRAAAAAPMMMFGRAKEAVGMLPNIMAAGKAGAITGGLSGLGSSEATTLGGAALDAGAGAALGFGLSAGSQPLMMGMGSIGGNVLSRFSDSAAQKYAKEKVAEAIVRDARGKAVQANPLAPFQQAATRFEKLGPEARLVDAGGQNARQLLDTVATLPGQSKQATEAAIRSRQSGRADRLIGQAERSLGTNGDRASQVVDDLVRTREQASRPLYGRLHKMEVGADPELSSLLAAAEQLGAGAAARKIATANRVPYSLSQDQWTASGGRLAMRDLDHMKQGLDELIEKATDPAGKLSPTGNALNNLRRDLLAKLDDSTGGFYKTARDAYSGPSALIDASNRGRRFMTADDAATRQAVAGLSTSEQEAFRLGAFEALRNKLGRPGGQTEVLGMWKDKILREKLQAVFPDERAFRQFASAASGESVMKGLEGVGRGSQTAARQYGAGDLDVPALADAVQSLSGAGGIPGFLAAAGRGWNRVQTPEPVRDAMGQMLLSQGGAGRNALMDIENTARLVAMQRNRNANALGVGVGSSAGSVSSNLLMPLMNQR